MNNAIWIAPSSSLYFEAQDIKFPRDDRMFNVSRFSIGEVKRVALLNISDFKKVKDIMLLRKSVPPNVLDPKLMHVPLFQRNCQRIITGDLALDADETNRCNGSSYREPNQNHYAILWD